MTKTYKKNHTKKNDNLALILLSYFFAWLKQEMTECTLRDGSGGCVKMDSEFSYGLHFQATISI